MRELVSPFFTDTSIQSSFSVVCQVTTMYLLFNLQDINSKIIFYIQLLI